MTEQCKKEIREYVEEKGWIYPVGYLFNIDDTIHPSYFFCSKKGKENNFEDKWEKEPEKMDKYMLEFIGHILRKHKIIEINVFMMKKYQSDTWRFNDIKLIN